MAQGGHDPRTGITPTQSEGKINSRNGLLAVVSICSFRLAVVEEIERVSC
jgi:hypothetical protein